MITIIGILIALLLPAVQAARESARKMQCANNVKQMALACLSHENATHYLPCNGWGYHWLGEPDRGVGVLQPGGWSYNILPQLEQQNLHDLGSGTTGTTLYSSLGQLFMTPLAVYNCPSRRPLGIYTVTPSANDVYNCISVTLAARIDYGINAGDQSTNQDPGPSDYTDGDNLNWSGWLPQSEFTGISFQRSRVAIANITDGTSNTYLVGEAAKMPDDYYNGEGNDDNHGPYTAFEDDSSRITSVLPVQDTPGFATDKQFGSVHAGSFNMGFCDGSTRAISYGIDPLTHDHLGNRADGAPIDATKY